jgi:hypothetical protein
MHNFQGKTTIFNFNSDLSGNVQILVKDSDPNKNQELWVNGQDILDFVAMYVSRHRIARYEARINAESTEETLGLLKS